ncbi:MAG TPA: glycosyltransferase family 2 protein [Candidatus Hydrogenedentes bacterium]|nr:glycosyltransferase family 2 protein [Candidatus Hydrogenedentota bacterium]
MESKTLVIIPAYNEAETIGGVVAGLRNHVPEYDILVVDDGSTDETAAAVHRLDGVKFVRLAYNLGIGAAMQTGYKYALRNGYDVAVQCDGDGQHPVREIRRLVEHVQAGDADLMIGSRYVADTGYRPSLSRRVGKSLLSRLVDALVGGGITDTTSGFRAANRKAITLFAHHYPDDYPEAEALVILHKAGFKAAEVAVEMSPRQGGRTSIDPKNAAYYMLKVALAIAVDVFRTFSWPRGGP